MECKKCKYSGICLVILILIFSTMVCCFLFKNKQENYVYSYVYPDKDKYEKKYWDKTRGQIGGGFFDGWNSYPRIL